MSGVVYLDPEIAKEGISADTPFQPAALPPVIPEYHNIKQLRKYFPQYSGKPYKHQPFPAVFYHPKEGSILVKDCYNNDPDDPKIIKTAKRWAEELGVRPAWDERGFFWECKGEWRDKPYEVRNDLTATGKVLQAGTPNPQLQQSEMITAVVAAVIAQMTAKQAQGTTALTGASVAAVDPEFVKWQAEQYEIWKASQGQKSSQQAGIGSLLSEGQQAGSRTEHKGMPISAHAKAK